MLRLDESLFDDDLELFTEADPTIAVFDEGSFDEYIDDDMIFEPIAGAGASADHNGEAVPEGPNAGLESGIADSLIKLINDEWEAIQGYNNFRDMILTMQKNGDGDYTNMLSVIDEVSHEENLHVGQLQELLKLISPNTSSIDKGEQEAKEQINASEHEWVNGKLVVQAHEPRAAESADTPNAVDTNCSIYDTDDEF